MKLINSSSHSCLHYGWFIVLLLWMSHFIYFFIHTSLWVLAPFIKLQMNLSNSKFGFLCSAVALGGMVAQIPGGIYSDRYGVRKVTSLGIMILGSAYFLFPFSTLFLFSSILTFFFGFGIGCIQVSAAKAIIDWFPFRGRATAMGIKQTGVSLGGIASSIFFPLMVYSYDWRFLLRGVGLTALLFAFLFFLLYRGPSNIEANPYWNKIRFRDIFSYLRNIDFLLVALAGVLFTAVQFSFSTYFVIYLSQTLRYSMELSGTLLAISFGTGGLARVVWSLGSDYLFRKRESILILIGGLGILVSVMLSLTTPSTSLWLIYLISILFGFTGMGWNAVWLTFIGELSLKESVGLGIGFSYFIANIGVVLGPPFFGFLTDLFHSFFWSWLFLAFCMMIEIFLIVWMAYISKKRESPFWILHGPTLFLK
jgi:ACS family hexuronate transporter-like MFS transporter